MQAVSENDGLYRPLLLPIGYIIHSEKYHCRAHFKFRLIDMHNSWHRLAEIGRVKFCSGAKINR